MTMAKKMMPKAVLVAVLAVLLASVNALGEGRSMMARVRELAALSCEVDDDCESDKVCFPKTLKCDLPSKKGACGRGTCEPGDDKRCTKNNQCANSKCIKSVELGYKTCTCNKNLVWYESATTESFCKRDGSVGTRTVSSACGCPEGMILERNGWCVEACCEGEMKPRKATFCTTVCGSSEGCIQAQQRSALSADDLICGCPANKPYFDAETGNCVKTEDQCSAAGKEAEECPDYMEMISGACPQSCSEPEGTICIQTTEERCACADGKIHDEENGECVDSFDDCPAGDGGVDDQTVECPDYMEMIMNACPKTCDEPTPMCALRNVERCACPYDGYHDEANGRCVMSESDCPVACESNKVWRVDMPTPCQQVCQSDPETIFCVQEISSGCFCPGDQWWDAKNEVCVDKDDCPPRDDMRL